MVFVNLLIPRFKTSSTLLAHDAKTTSPSHLTTTAPLPLGLTPRFMLLQY